MTVANLSAYCWPTTHRRRGLFCWKINTRFVNSTNPFIMAVHSVILRNSPRCFFVIQLDEMLSAFDKCVCVFVCASRKCSFSSAINIYRREPQRAITVLSESGSGGRITCQPTMNEDHKRDGIFMVGEFRLRRVSMTVASSYHLWTVSVDCVSVDCLYLLTVCCCRL